MIRIPTGLLLLAAIALMPPEPLLAAEPRPMVVDDLFRFLRVSDPQVSPDGKTVVCTVGKVDLAANKVVSSLWTIESATGKGTQLTSGPKSDKHPRFSPDGKTILFESARSGSMQLWTVPAAGGEPKQLTNIATGASTGIWSRDGQTVAFVSAVWPEFSDKPFAESDAANKKKAEDAEKSPVKAKVFTRLFYRHWDEYTEDKRQHLFTLRVSTGDEQIKKLFVPLDVTPGDRDAYPTSSTFSIGDDFTFSADGSHLIFTAVPDRDEAWSTNHDICRVPVVGGKVETLTANKAADVYPVLSPSGKRLAYRRQAKPGYEADKWELVVVDVDAAGKFTSEPKSVNAKIDRSCDGFTWVGEDRLRLVMEENARTHLWEVTLADGMPKIVVPGNYIGSPTVSRDGSVMAYTRAATNHPALVQIVSGEKTVVFDPNAGLLKELNLPRPESVEIAVEGAKMQMWILKPPGFDPKKKWPLMYMIHGGPQGAWEDGWSNRWNPEIWAAQGYVVALPNPRGSTGFGQKYVDEISGDWGGKCYDDLMKGLAYLEGQKYIDTDRMAAAGGSFGGYMMNWFAVNTGKFKTLVTHCSVYNFDSMYATTDELWFDEYEHGGPPWGTNRESYEKHSPAKKAANLAKFKTPMLIIHNDLDFRCPIGQGHELFTTLQRLGVKSKMINFPDEGHWVLKPKNSEYWHESIFSWLKTYCPPGAK